MINLFPLLNACNQSIVIVTPKYNTTFFVFDGETAFLGLNSSTFNFLIRKKKFSESKT